MVLESQLEVQGVFKAIQGVLAEVLSGSGGDSMNFQGCC